MAYRLLSLTAISGEFPTDQLNRLPGSPYYLESVVTALKKDGLLRTYYRDKLRGYRLGPRAKATLLESRPDRFASYLTGDTDTNRLKCEIDRRLRLHRLAETYVTMDNAGVCVYRDEKPAIFAPDGYAGGRIVYPAFFSSREVKEMGIDTTKIRSSRSTGILLAPSGIFVTYNSSSALMKWRYKSEMRVKALIWSVICQQRLAPQFRHEDVHGLILGNSMDLAYQILTSTGGRKHDFFMLDGSYEHFLYLTNNHQGEVILALLCDPVKTAELDRILLQGLTARQPGLAIEHDGVSPDGSPVLFGYFCDLPRYRTLQHLPRTIRAPRHTDLFLTSRQRYFAATVVPGCASRPLISQNSRGGCSHKQEKTDRKPDCSALCHSCDSIRRRLSGTAFG